MCPVHNFAAEQEVLGSVRMLILAIFIFYIEKHGQIYPQSLKKHEMFLGDVFQHI
jgi:hypothetical protein